MTTKTLTQLNRTNGNMNNINQKHKNNEITKITRRINTNKAGVRGRTQDNTSKNGHFWHWLSPQRYFEATGLWPNSSCTWACSASPRVDVIPGWLERDKWNKWSMKGWQGDPTRNHSHSRATRGIFIPTWCNRDQEIRIQFTEKRNATGCFSLFTAP